MNRNRQVRASRTCHLLSQESMRCLLERLCREQHGQDLIEYGLLAALVGLAGVGGWLAIETALGNAYGSWNSAVYSLWESPAPSSSGS
jgi:Flp pilus assembly pilin Flp